MNFEPIKKSYTFKENDLPDSLKWQIAEFEKQRGYRINGVFHNTRTGTVTIEFYNEAKHGGEMTARDVELFNLAQLENPVI